MQKDLLDLISSTRSPWPYLENQKAASPEQTQYRAAIRDHLGGETGQHAV